MVISGDLDISFDRFDKYVNVTVELYVHSYTWYRMSSSVRKQNINLLFGSHYNYVFFPIGQLSEEAQESRNKDLRLYYKISRKYSPY